MFGKRHPESRRPPFDGRTVGLGDFAVPYSNEKCDFSNLAVGTRVRCDSRNGVGSIELEVCGDGYRVITEATKQMETGPPLELKDIVLTYEELIKLFPRAEFHAEIPFYY